MFQRISTTQVASMIKEKEVKLADIRDPHSFHAGHIKNAVHLTQDNVTEFLEKTDKTLPLVIYCYHGNSSQQAAQFFYEQGFEDVYSMDGGFDVWKSEYDFEVSDGNS